MEWHAEGRMWCSASWCRASSYRWCTWSPCPSINHMHLDRIRNRKECVRSHQITSCDAIWCDDSATFSTDSIPTRNFTLKTNSSFGIRVACTVYAVEHMNRTLVRFIRWKRPSPSAAACPARRSRSPPSPRTQTTSASMYCTYGYKRKP